MMGPECVIDAHPSINQRQRSEDPFHPKSEARTLFPSGSSSTVVVVDTFSCSFNSLYNIYSLSSLP
jgi:hypothetical protein